MSAWDWVGVAWLGGGGLFVSAVHEVLHRGGHDGLDVKEFLLGLIVWPFIMLGFAAGWCFRRWL